MVSYLFGLESMALPDLRARRRRRPGLLARVGDLQGRPGPSSSGTRPTGRCSSAAARATCETEPYEKILRDIRIFPIFEGANDVMRAFIALSGMKPVGEKLSGLGEIGLGDPIGSIGVLADYVGGRIQREVRPDRITRRTRSSTGTPTPSPTRSRSCAASPSRCCASTRKEIVERQFQPRSGSPTRRRHLRPGRGALAGDLDLRGRTASSPRARSATSPRPSAPAPPTASAGTFAQIESQRRRADDGDREARLQARRVRLRAVRGLSEAAQASSLPPRRRRRLSRARGGGGVRPARCPRPAPACHASARRSRSPPGRGRPRPAWRSNGAAPCWRRRRAAAR